jgi:hypothetical protein
MCIFFVLPTYFYSFWAKNQAILANSILVYNLFMELQFGKEPGFRKVTPLPEEIEKVRKEAIGRNQSPDAAEAAFRKKLERANDALKS